jgi:hypothetical protein
MSAGLGKPQPTSQTNDHVNFRMRHLLAKSLDSYLARAPMIKTAHVARGDAWPWFVEIREVNRWLS